LIWGDDLLGVASQLSCDHLCKVWVRILLLWIGFCQIRARPFFCSSRADILFFLHPASGKAVAVLPAPALWCRACPEGRHLLLAARTLGCSSISVSGSRQVLAVLLLGDQLQQHHLGCCVPPAGKQQGNRFLVMINMHVIVKL
jgi:hypothetical protein